MPDFYFSRPVMTHRLVQLGHLTACQFLHELNTSDECWLQCLLSADIYDI